ncbi:hypothetical protein [Sabulicella glaciei]|uniref:Uncharacterized protein n=1 Tax=Sabulicella glaciei TaxID=2984948 RepID=A0ABT3NW83_9PROT|nr:hypothetical protein [Roseococcus sp. MDT2-1-1]MCW8086138.1 hypothetical protein [Roseococcus sp. MDT2-1-1]
MKVDLTEGTGLRGHLDVVDWKHGIRGWAVDLGAPSNPVRLELLAGQECVARVVTSRSRPDVVSAAGVAAEPGFAFGADELRELPALALEQPEARLSVRVDGEALLLRAAQPMPTLREFLKDHIEEQNALRLERLLENDLEAALAHLQNEVRPLAGQELLAKPDGMSGFIEAVSTETAGLLPFFGWIRGAGRTAIPGLLVDRGHHPSAVAFASFPRADLPDGAHGVIGVIKTDWQPQDPNDVALLHFGEGASLHLRTNLPLAKLRNEEWLECFDRHRPRLTGPLVSKLRRLVSVHSWAPGNAAKSGVPMEQSVDRIVALPGFGVFVEGWVLSPTRRPEALMLRLGARILRSDPLSTFFKPRPDVARVIPGSARLADAAGFVAAFRGDIGPEDLKRPILKFIFEDGAATNHELDARTLFVLGHAAKLEDLRHLYRDPTSEDFFPDLVRALAEAERPRLREMTPVKVAPAPRALIVALPDDASEIHLAFSELTAMARRKRLPGVAVIAQSGAHRALAMSLFKSLDRRGAAACSLFLVPRAENAAYVLPEVIKRVNCAHLAFLGPGLHPDRAATDAIEVALCLPERAEGFGLPILSGTDCGGPARHSSAEAFVAKREEVLAALAELPVRLGGLGSRRLRLPLPLASGKGCVRRGWGADPGRMLNAANDALSGLETGP